MFDKKKYTNLSLLELVTKQTFLIKLQKAAVVVASILIGNVFYTIYKQGHTMHPFLLLGTLFYIVYIPSELKKVQLQINKRKN